MCWVYLLKNKSDAFQTFKNFHKWIENDAQSHIGSIRIHTDNGKEYTSNEFEHYLRQHGIKHQTPVPYNPQQNGVVERMNRAILNMPGPSQKGPPKWLTKTLESVHPDEIGKTGTRNSNRQNGVDVDDSNSPVDMDVSYDCELNLSTDFEPTSFKEAASHDEWKEAMQKEYDAFIKNGTWKLVDPPLGTKPIGCKWVYKNKYKADGSLDKHKARLVAKGFS
eukprot:PITA_34343